MATWQDVKDKISVKKTNSPVWNSDYHSLLEIIDAADEAGLNPELLDSAIVSNMRCVIASVRQAIKDENYKDIVRLFKAARDLTNTDLRLLLNPERVTEVKYITRRTASERMKYTVTFNPEQFKKVRSSTRQRIKFTEIQ